VRHAAAWTTLCLALALHVADEALTGFLSVYNPTVDSIRGKLPWLPLPTFTFEAWLGGLIVAVIVLSSLTVLVLRGSQITLVLSYVFGTSMLLNGLLHIAGTVAMGRPMPGVYSAPLLLAASVYLLLTVNSVRRSKK
jgi:hypothetical protein